MLEATLVLAASRQWTGRSLATLLTPP